MNGVTEVRIEMWHFIAFAIAALVLPAFSSWGTVKLALLRLKKDGQLETGARVAGEKLQRQHCNDTHKAVDKTYGEDRESRRALWKKVNCIDHKVTALLVKAGVQWPNGEG